jgi:N-acetylglucosamine-6-phosphate deacetylase
MARLRQLRALRENCPEVREVIAGWHVEGPFLSPKPGFHGAHDPAVMIDPRPDHFEELRAVVGDDPVLTTLAPERRGAIEAIARARALNIHVSLGHTDASAEQLRDAVAAGAEGFTHLGNGCPQQLDRHDNILWRVLDTPGLMIGLIPDGLHVSPPLFRLIHRLVAPDRIYYTTDAMAAAGSPPGEYTVGGLRVVVGEDGVVRHPGRSNFAGSALRPDQVDVRVRRMLGAAAAHAVPALEGNAARWLALAGDR